MQTQIEPIPSELDVAMAYAKKLETQPGFLIWLRDEFPIFKRFVEEADAVRKVRDHYSARTIIEYIRHETTLREDGIFKINNNVAPDCARLYMAIRGCDKFFDTRGR